MRRPLAGMMMMMIQMWPKHLHRLACSIGTSDEIMIDRKGIKARKKQMGGFTVEGRKRE